MISSAIRYLYVWFESKRILSALRDAADNIDILESVVPIAELFKSDSRATVFSADAEEGVEVTVHSYLIFLNFPIYRHQRLNVLHIEHLKQEYKENRITISKTACSGS